MLLGLTLIPTGSEAAGRPRAAPRILALGGLPEATPFIPVPGEPTMSWTILKPLCPTDPTRIRLGGAALVAAMFASSAPAAEFLVSSASEINSALNVAGPGDTLVMTDGVWTNQTINFSADGTSANPITLRAQTPGGVVLTGTSNLRISGDHLVVDGLYFKDGNASSAGHVVQFRGTNGNATNSRLTNTVIESYNPPDIDTRYFWVSLYGENNRVDHNRFIDQNHSGVTVVAWLDNNDGAAHRIDANQFADRPVPVNPSSTNGFETIRIGTSDFNATVSNVVVENNVFERTDGEIEIISNKSTGNAYQYNTFRASAGTLTLRHGGDANVEGNFFLGEGKDHSGGIRVIGEDHTIVNNYIADIDDRAYGAISISAGVENTPANGYEQVKNALIAHNTIVNVGGAAIKLDQGLGSSDRTLLAEDVTLAANLVRSSSGPLFEGAEGTGFTWEDNLAFGASLGISARPGVTVADPKLELGADGLWRPAADSPAVDAISSGSFTTVDMDGQARIGLFDIGADERSVAQIVRKPLLSNDVGASWYTYGDGGPIDPLPAAGPYLVREAEHFTSITDPDGDGDVWEVALTGDASNNEVIVSPSGSRTDLTTDPHETLALYDLSFSEPGTYTAYYLGRGFSTASDSFFTPDGFEQDPDNQESLSNDGLFRWETGGAFTITESNVDVPLEFRLGRREGQAQLDAFVFHPSSSLSMLQLDAILDLGAFTLGDINADEALTPADLIGSPVNFETLLYSRNTQYSPAADVNYDGMVDNLDLFGLRPVLVDGGADQATLDTYGVVLRRRGDINETSGTDAADIDFLFDQVGTSPADGYEAWLYDLDVNGSITQGDVDTLVRAVFATEYGDANLDGDVDVFQFNGGGDAQILTSNLGTTSGAGWSDGDFNGDGDVDVFQFDGGGDAQLLTSNLGFGSAAAASLAVVEEADGAVAVVEAMTASGTYDPETGGVVIEIGSGVGVVGLESLVGGDLVPTNLTDALAAAQATEDTIAFFNAAGLAAGTYDLGAIVVPGTPIADLGFGYTPMGGAFTTVGLRVVPEPATAGLMLTLGWLAVRRGRSVA